MALKLSVLSVIFFFGVLLQLFNIYVSPDMQIFFVIIASDLFLLFIILIGLIYILCLKAFKRYNDFHKFLNFMIFGLC